MKTIETYEQPGDVLTLNAPYDVTGGDGLLVGKIFGIASSKALAGKPVEVCLEGVFKINAASGDTAATGALVYWSDAARAVSFASGVLIGALTEDKQAGQVVARVNLNRGPSVDGAGNSGVTLQGVSGLNQIVTAIIAAGWAYDSVQWKRNTSGTIVNATGPGATTLTYTQVALDVVAGVNIYPDFANLRYIGLGLTAPALAPGAPTIGTATAGDGTATFAFTAPASDGGSAIIEYEVIVSNGIRKTVSGAPASITVDTINGVAVTATVRARNAVDYGPASAPSNSVTPAATPVTAPVAPLMVTAIPSDGAATFYFAAPSSTGGSPILDYQLSLSDGTTRTVTASPAVVTGLTNGAAVTARVRARNAVDYSNYSAQCLSITPSAPATVVAPIETTALKLSGAYLSLPDTSQWDLPAGDFSIAVLIKPMANTGSVSKHIFSTGAMAATETMNLSVEGTSGGTPGRLRFCIGNPTGSTFSLYSVLPYTDDVWRVVVVGRQSGVMRMKSCAVHGTVISEDSNAATTAIPCNNAPNIGQVSPSATSRNYTGGIAYLFKNNTTFLSDADILALGNGTAPGALAGVTWDIALTFSGTAATYTDASGNGNTATRSSTSAATVAGPTYGPKIALPTLSGKRVMQRNKSGGTRPLTISGVWNGPVGNLEMRVIDFETGAEVATWADVVTNSNGVFVASRQCSTHTNWLTLEVRSKAYPEIISRTMQEWGVGIVIATPGASNMANMSSVSTGQPTTGDLVSRYDRPYGAGWSGGVNGMGLRTLLNAIQPGTNLPVAVFQVGTAGTALNAEGNEGPGWWTNLETGPFRSMADALAEVGGDFEMILSNFGGQDARHTPTKAALKAGLGNFYAYCQELVGRTAAELPFIQLGCCRYGQSLSTAANTGYQTLREAQIEFANETPGVVDGGATYDVPLGSDQQHHEAPGYQWIARRAAQTVRKVLGLEAYSGAGPKIAGVARTLADIDVTVIQNGGAAIEVATAGSATGFEVSLNSNFSSLLTIASTSFPSANVIRLTLSANPGAPVYVRYAAGQMPDVTRPVYDDRTIQTDATGAVLQPTVGSLVAA